ncbi:MAG: 50S ribosomal protein L9 [Bacteroidota bacterium]
MEVILKQDIQGLGYKNERVAVQPGYARNYLIPAKMAVVAHAANQKVALENAKQTAHKRLQEKKNAEAVAAQIGQLKLVLEAKAGEQGKIFGSITPAQLANALEEHRIQLNPKHIHLAQPVKTVGVHEATLDLHREVKCTLSFEVVAAADSQTL